MTLLGRFPFIGALLLAYFICFAYSQKGTTGNSLNQGSSSNTEKSTTGRVVSLHTDNFNEYVRQGSLFVNFYSPNCGHCRRFQSTWSTIAEVLQNDKITVGKVNIVTEAELAKTYNIINTPTVIFFRGKTPYVYKGELDAEAIIRFYYRKISPILSLNDREEVEDFIVNWETAVIGFFEDSAQNQKEISVQWKAFRDCASKNPNTEKFGFGFISEPSLLSLYVEKSPLPNVVIFKEFEGISQSSKENWKDICSWIVAEGEPALQEWSWSEQHKAALAGTPIGILYLDTPNLPAHSGKLLTDLRVRAQSWKGRVKLFYVEDGSTKLDQIKQYGGRGTLPTFILHAPFKHENYPIDDAASRSHLEAENIVNWMSSYFAGKLVSKMRSEDNLHHTHEHIQLVNSKSFPDIVLDRSKDVLLQLHTTVCHDCTEFNPTFELLGEVLCETDSVVIAKMNIDRNDLPPGIVVPTKHYPQLVLFPARTKGSPKVYSGDRSLQSIVEFINKNASVRFALPRGDLNKLEEEKKKGLNIQANVPFQRKKISPPSVLQSRKEVM